ncbi:MAG: AAA family ATPase [Thermoanaerobaculia bacterium]|nr:AAA family ATPase [Thermoanaerobaculia bacterium]
MGSAVAGAHLEGGAAGAKDLIANDETEISEVIRRRLFEDLGNEKTRKNVAKAFGDWCFERRAQLPPEWTAVDTATTEARARELLQKRFEACYPFHPATLSVFQRKWQALPQYQQTRGTLAMLAQWIAIAARDSFEKARKEPLITLGSAPLGDPGFRSVVLGSSARHGLLAAIDADVAGEQAHSKALDVDTKAALRDIHRRVATAILFESSGGQSEKVAHLPELRFALGEPALDTTSIDNAALAVESRSYFIRKQGSDGFRIGYQPTLKKVVSDRRASLDDDAIKSRMRELVEAGFRHAASLPVELLGDDPSAIPDRPKLTLVVVGPEHEWTGNGGLRARLGEWTRLRGSSPRLYPGALVWCLKKPGRDLREKVELELAWKRVGREVADGTLGGEFEKGDRADLQAKIKEAEETAKEEIWGSYRYALVSDALESEGLKLIDLGAGHSSSGKTQCGRVLEMLRQYALVNESIGAGYLERNWPPALKESGAWPLASLRQSFLNGSLTRLIDPDAVLKSKIRDFVAQGEFGLASGQRADGSYERVWLGETVAPEEVAFEPGVYLLRKEVAKATEPENPIEPEPTTAPGPAPYTMPEPGTTATPEPATVETRTLRLVGNVPPEQWNRIGVKILPRLRTAGTDLEIGVDLAVTVSAANAASLTAELQTTLQELGLLEALRVE